MDFGLPAAVGAKVAALYETIINIGGDANFNIGTPDD
jgi:thiamine pyrophosphate-dependent acetolactate synthase large subunit-like protein